MLGAKEKVPIRDTTNGTRLIKVTSGPHLGYKLPVLLVQVGCGCHVVLPDADLALFSRSGQEQNHHHHRHQW